MRTQTFCDGIRRRDLLRVGTAGLFGIGLPLSQILERQTRASESKATTPPARASALITIFLHGGLSTIDTIDMKPNAPAEFRGEFNPIATNVPGIEVCEHLPRVAQQLDKFSLIRSFTHHDSNHGAADHYMLTGYYPRPGFNGSLKPNNHFPAHGSVIAKKLGPRGSVPAYVCLPRMHNSCGPAYLGSTAAPFVVEADPNSPSFSVPDLMPPLTIEPTRLDARTELLGKIDRYRRAAEIRANSGAQAMSVFQEKAFELMTSRSAQAAFDIHQESDSLRDEYGRTSLGQSCLMARRLVEAGVRSVTVDHSNWDTHYNNFEVLRKDLLPHLDAALAALFRDLADRGLLENTLVAIYGEFGRTPRINKDAGRDHWGPSNTIIVGGGGIVGGRVIGASNERAEKPASDPLGPEDLSATLFHLLGIDPDEEFYTPEGRPIKIANNGRLISDLL